MPYKIIVVYVLVTMVERLAPPDIYDVLNLDFQLMERREFLERGAQWCSPSAAGEINRVEVMGYTPPATDPSEAIVRVIKVPRNSVRARAHGRAEIAICRLVAEAAPQCPYEVQVIDRVEKDPFYFVLTPAHGTSIDRSEELHVTEQLALGRAIARIAMWEDCIGVNQYKEAVLDEYQRDDTDDPHNGVRWNWPRVFSEAFKFDDSNFPSLSAAASEMRSLQARYCPGSYPLEQDRQVIHGDLRRSNLLFSGAEGERVVCAVIDWGMGRIGNRLEECRNLWGVGQLAIAAANDEFAKCDQAKLDPEGLRFWYDGRLLVALIQQLRNRMPRYDAFTETVLAIRREFSYLDWSELPIVKPRTGELPLFHQETGAPFSSNLNGVRELTAVW
jgi:Phosphotransferase enzyme family